MTSRTILLDGGLSTALEELGNSLNTTLWSGELLRTAPDQIRAAHKAYVDAGAEIIITASYQISYPGCIARGWSDQEVTDALHLSVQLAREAGAPKVAASVGPYGAYLADGSEYRGNYGISEDQLRDFHKRRLEVLISAKPDYLAVETIPDMKEAKVILELLGELKNTIPFWISFSCKEDGQLNSGESFHDAAELAKSMGASFVGINCTSPELVSELLDSAQSCAPFVIYPNAGRYWDAEKKEWIGAAAKLSGDHIHQWIERGAQIIGGCCGIGPQVISEVRFPSHHSN